MTSASLLYFSSILHERDNPTPLVEIGGVLSSLTRAIEVDNELERREFLVKLRAMYGRIKTSPEKRKAICDEYIGASHAAN